MTINIIVMEKLHKITCEQI